MKANGEKPRGEKEGEKKQDEGKRRKQNCLSACCTLRRRGRAAARAREACKSLSVKKEPEEEHDASVPLFLNPTRRVRRRNRREGEQKGNP